MSSDSKTLAGSGFPDCPATKEAASKANAQMTLMDTVKHTGPDPALFHRLGSHSAKRTNGGIGAPIASATARNSTASPS